MRLVSANTARIGALIATIFIGPVAAWAEDDSRSVHILDGPGATPAPAPTAPPIAPAPALSPAAPATPAAPSPSLATPSPTLAPAPPATPSPPPQLATPGPALAPPAPIVPAPPPQLAKPAPTAPSPAPQLATPSPSPLTPLAPSTSSLPPLVPPTTTLPPLVAPPEPSQQAVTPPAAPPESASILPVPAPAPNAPMAPAPGGSVPATAPPNSGVTSLPPQPGNLNAPSPVTSLPTLDGKIAVANPADLSIDILPSQYIKVGARVTFRVSTKQPGYLILVDVDSTGKLNQIYPNPMSLMAATNDRQNPHANFIKPGEPIHIPDPKSAITGGYEFVASPPLGTAMVVAILSDRPVQLVDLPDVPRSMVGQGAAIAYLNKVASELRVPPADGGGPLLEPKWSLDAKFYAIR